MKKKVLLVTFLFFYLKASHVFAQWTSQTISSYTLYDIFFTSPLNGYIGTQNTIFTTTDGGTLWTPTVFTGPSASIMSSSTYLSIHFTSATTGYAAGFCAGNQKRIIIRTLDAGATWNVVLNSGLTGFYIFRKITFANPTNGFAVGEQCAMRTTDGGNTWQNFTVPNASSYDFEDVEFSDANTGFILGDGQMFKTVDGGSSWSLVPNLSWGFKAIHFYNADTGYVAGTSGTIYKTLDSGMTWNGSVTNLSQSFYACHVLNNDTCFAAGDGVIAITRTGGDYWETQSYGSSLTVNQVFFTSQDTGFAVCDSGVVLRTFNAGGPSAPIAGFTYQNSLYCTGDSIFFHAYGSPAYTYQWKINGNSFATGQDAGYYFTTAGTFNIELITDNGFFTDTAFASVNVTLNTLDTAINFTYNNDTLCWSAGFVIQITNSQWNVNYSLLRNDTLSGIPQAGNGGFLQFSSAALNYPCTMKLRASNTCGNYILGQPISVFVYQFPDTSLQVSLLDSLLCRGHEFTAPVQINNSQAGYTYSLWGPQFYGSEVSTGGNFVFLSDTITQPLNLAVKVTADYGYCQPQLVDSIFVDYDSLYSKFTTTDIEVKLADSTYFLSNSTNASNLDWTFGTGANLASYNGIATPAITYSSTGNKQVELIATSAKGCADTSYKNIKVYSNVQLIHPDCWYNVMRNSNANDIASDGENIYISVKNQYAPQSRLLTNIMGDTIVLPGQNVTNNCNVIKFNTDGAFNWLFYGENIIRADINFNKYNKDIVIDAGTNLSDPPLFYSANGIDTLGTQGFWGGIVRYDYTGAIKWLRPGWGAAFDANNNIYYYPSSQNLNKMDTAANLLWTIPFSPSFQSYYTTGCDSGNFIYTSKAFSNGLTLLKINISGVITDSVQILVLAGGFSPYSLKYYQNSLYLECAFSNTIVIGNDTLTYNSTAGNVASVLVRFDSALNPLWHSRFGGGPGNGVWMNNDLKFNNNIIYTSGYFDHNFYFEKSFLDSTDLLKNYIIGIDTSGQFRSYLNTGYSSYFGPLRGIDFDNDGKAYLLAEFAKDITVGKDTIPDPFFSSGWRSTILMQVGELSAPVVSANGPVIFCQGGSVTLTVSGAFTSYFWNNGATTSSITVSDSGAYFAVLNDNSGCKIISNAIIVKLINCTSIEQNNKNITNLSVIPNPFNSEVTIKISRQNLKQISFNIKDILGQTVFSKQENNLSNTYTKTIDLSFLSKGIYFLDLNVDGERTVKKIVKE